MGRGEGGQDARRCRAGAGAASVGAVEEVDDAGFEVVLAADDDEAAA